MNTFDHVQTRVLHYVKKQSFSVQVWPCITKTIPLLHYKKKLFWFHSDSIKNTFNSVNRYNGFSINKKKQTSIQRGINDLRRHLYTSFLIGIFKIHGTLNLGQTSSKTSDDK